MLSDVTLVFLIAALAAEHQLPRMLNTFGPLKAITNNVRKVIWVTLAYALALLALIVLAPFQWNVVVLAAVLAGLHFLISMSVAGFQATPSLLLKNGLLFIVITEAVEWVWPDLAGIAHFDVGYGTCIKWLLLFTLITAPANDLFKTLFARYQLKSEGQEMTEPGAGALIGSLE